MWFDTVCQSEVYLTASVTEEVNVATCDKWYLCSALAVSLYLSGSVFLSVPDCFELCACSFLIRI